MPEKLRILQLNSARKYVGEAAHTLNLTEALRRRGHSVWLGLRKGYDTFERAKVRSLEPLEFNMPHRWWPPQDGPDIKHIARLVRENNIDLIHAHRGKDHWQAVLATRLFHLKVPVIRTRHVVTPLVNNAANRWLAKRTAAMVLVSRAVESDVRSTGLYAGERLVFIPGGIDLQLFKPATLERRKLARQQFQKLFPAVTIGNNDLLAACVARFAKVKAHSILIAAWKCVVGKLPHARLVLIGDGQRMSDAQAQTAHLGLQQHVLFLGRRHDIPELLDGIDLGVLSSIGSEGFSRAVLEYMAKGLPTVATRVGAVPDLIEHEMNGLISPPNDEVALANALIQALSAEEEKRRAWGHAARHKAERGYGYESWAAAHEQLYARVLNAKN